MEMLTMPAVNKKTKAKPYPTKKAGTVTKKAGHFKLAEKPKKGMVTKNYKLGPKSKKK
jgi:hypothetical protein